MLYLKWLRTMNKLYLLIRKQEPFYVSLFKKRNKCEYLFLNFIYESKKLTEFVDLFF